MSRRSSSPAAPSGSRAGSARRRARTRRCGAAGPVVARRSHGQGVPSHLRLHAGPARRGERRTARAGGLRTHPRPARPTATDRRNRTSRPRVAGGGGRLRCRAAVGAHHALPRAEGEDRARRWSRPADGRRRRGDRGCGRAGGRRRRAFRRARGAPGDSSRSPIRRSQSSRRSRRASARRSRWPRPVPTSNGCACSRSASRSPRNLHDEVTQDLIARPARARRARAAVADPELRGELAAACRRARRGDMRLRDVVAGLDGDQSAGGFVDVLRSITGNKAERPGSTGASRSSVRWRGSRRRARRAAARGERGGVQRGPPRRRARSRVTLVSWATASVVMVEDDGVGLGGAVRSHLGIANCREALDDTEGRLRAHGAREGGDPAAVVDPSSNGRCRPGRDRRSVGPGRSAELREPALVERPARVVGDLPDEAVRDRRSTRCSRPRRPARRA